jgi:hypothetical protein
VTGRDYASDFREIKSMGANTVQSFALAGEDPAYVDGYLKAADEAGLGVVAFVGKFIDGQDDSCALSPAGADFVRSHAGGAGAARLAHGRRADQPPDHQGLPAAHL